MSEAYATQALSTSHADLVTSLAFSSSAPSLLASTSLDGWIRIHARMTAELSSLGIGKDNATPSNGVNQDDMNGDDNDNAPQETQNEWVEIGGCKANEGPVWRAIWGPREYGTSILVSIAGSVVNVWELKNQQIHDSKLEVTKRATLVEARGSLRDVSFAPFDFGMKLASIAADSHLRIYECLDPSSSGLGTWSLLEDIDLLPLPNTYYSPSSSSHGSHLPHQQTQLIKGFDEQVTARQGSLGPSGGSSASLGAQSTASTSNFGKARGRIESSGAWALSYCQEAWWGECVAVSAGKEGLIRIIQFTPPSYWIQLVVLTLPNTASASPISTIAWAPSCGRSYHLIASGSRDGCVRIWNVTPSIQPGTQWEASIAAEITDHMDGGSGGIGRVEWNVTGTVLSTAGCDGVVRLWKSTYSGEWRCLSSISVEGEEGTTSNARH